MLSCLLIFRHYRNTWQSIPRQVARTPETAISVVSPKPGEGL